MMVALFTLCPWARFLIYKAYVGKITTTLHSWSPYCIYAFVFLCIIFSYSSWQTHGDVDVWQEILCPFRHLGMLRLRTIRCWVKILLILKLLFLLHNSSFFTDLCCGGCWYKEQRALGAWIQSMQFLGVVMIAALSLITFVCWTLNALNRQS